MPFNFHNQYSDSEPNAPPRAPAIVLARGLAVVNHPPVIIRRCTLLQTLFKNRKLHGPTSYPGHIAFGVVPERSLRPLACGNPPPGQGSARGPQPPGKIENI